MPEMQASSFSLGSSELKPNMTMCFELGEKLICVGSFESFQCGAFIAKAEFGPVG
jgi:hypothetical protein